MLLLMRFDNPTTHEPASKESGPDYKTLREKLFAAKTFQELLGSATSMRDFCRSLGSDAEAKKQAEKGAMSIVEAVLRREDDGVSVKLVNSVGDDPKSAARLLKLAYNACDNFPDLQTKVLDKLASLQSEFPDDAFLSQSVQKFEGLISLSAVGIEKTDKEAKTSKTKIAKIPPAETPEAETTTTQEQPPQTKTVPAQIPDTQQETPSTELTPFDVAGAQEALAPVAYPAPIMPEEDYQKRVSMARDLASIARQSKNGQTPDGKTVLDYAKIIFNSATWVGEDGQISLTVRSGSKEATANRQIEMYLLAYECVRSDPAQSIAFFQYIDQQYQKASDTELDGPGKTRLQRAQAGLAVFCLNMLQQAGSGSSPMPPALLGALFNTLVVSSGIGSLGAGGAGPSPEMRQQVLQALWGLLQSDEPQIAIPAARALRMFKYDSLEQKQESVGLMLKALTAHPAWTLSEQRLLLEEAIRLDIRLEGSAPADRVFNARDPAADPYLVMDWFKARPELMIHALLVCSGSLVPVSSFAPDAERPASSLNLPRMDGVATYRWMDLMQDYVTGIFGFKDGKPSGPRDEEAISKFKNDRTLSADYGGPYSSMPLSTLYLSLLDRIKKSASRFAPELSSQAWANYNEFNKLLK